MDFTVRLAKPEDCRDVSRMVTPYEPGSKTQEFLCMEKVLIFSDEDYAADCRILHFLNWSFLGNAASYTGASIQRSKELAVHIKMPDGVKITHKELERDGFSANPLFQCVVAEVPEEHRSKEGHTLVGYAVFFYTYGTWRGRAMHLDDLYVMPEFRGRGIGKAIFSKVAAVGKEMHCAHLQLSVLDWNTQARNFYLTQGARDLTAIEDCHLFRFDREVLDKLAEKAPKN